MIKSFKCKETEKIFKGEFSSKLPSSIQQKAKYKLDILHMAFLEKDLNAPPGNKVEHLKGDLKGYCIPK